MTVAEYIKLHHNFNDPSVVKKFSDHFGYTTSMMDKILNGTFPILLSCQVDDIALFTGEDRHYLWSLNKKSPS